MSIESRLKKLEKINAPIKKEDNNVVITIGKHDLKDENEKFYVSSSRFDEPYRMMALKEYEKWIKDSKIVFDKVITVTDEDWED